MYKKIDFFSTFNQKPPQEAVFDNNYDFGGLNFVHPAVLIGSGTISDLV